MKDANVLEELSKVVQLRDHPHCNAAPERLMRGCMCYSLHCSPRLSEPQTRPDRKCSQVAIAIARGLVILRYDLCLFVACHIAKHEPALHLVTTCALHPNLHHEFNQSIDYNPPRPLVACPLTRPSSRTCSHQELVKNSIKAHLSHCTTSSRAIKASHPKKTLSFLPLLFTNPPALVESFNIAAVAHKLHTQHITCCLTKSFSLGKCVQASRRVVITSTRIQHIRCFSLP